MSYLKWVGSKKAIAHLIYSQFPTNIGKYIEPFCGSGAMYLAYAAYLERQSDDIYCDEALCPKQFILSDTNEPLVNCHFQVARKTTEVIDALGYFESEHSKEFYEQERKLVTRVNDPIISAARFIYINKACFNGLWRVNQKGEFNTPWNQKQTIRLPIYLDRPARLLNRATLWTYDFEECIKKFALSPEDFVYMDPPYYPLSKTSSFTSYTASGFDPDKGLERLKVVCDDMNSWGVRWLMSNSSAPEVYEKFKNYTITEVSAPRHVKAIKSGEKRETVQETLIRNY